MDLEGMGFVDASGIDFSDEKAVLEAALKNEIKGKELYLQYAKTVKSEMARKVFEHLATEELTHIEDIKAFIRSGGMGDGVDVDNSQSDTSTLPRQARL